MTEPVYRATLAYLLEVKAGLSFTNEQCGLVEDVLQALCYDRRDLVAFLSLVDIALLECKDALAAVTVQDSDRKLEPLLDALKKTHPDS